MLALERVLGDDLESHGFPCPRCRARHVNASLEPAVRSMEWSGDGERSPDQGQAQVFRQLERPNGVHAPVVRGFGFTLDAMWAGSLEAESSETCTGIEDARGLLRRTARSLGAARDERGLLRRAYRASKKLVWFDHSGHEAFVDEPRNSTRRW